MNNSESPICDTYALDFAPEATTSDDAKLEVRAVADGDIIFSKNQDDFGKTILIKHGGNILSRYAHLNELSVTSGRVRKGQKIGIAGTTGNSTARHLHFVMYKLKMSEGSSPSVSALKPEPLGGITGFKNGTAPSSKRLKFKNINNKLICIENCETIFPIQIYDNLMWDTNSTTTSNWFSAENYCDVSKRFNYEDWRLPTKFELKRTVYCSNGKPTPLDDQESCPGFGYDVSVDIPTVVNDLPLTHHHYWSGTRVAADAFFAIDYSDGRGSFFTNSNDFKGVCVRSK